MSRETSGWSWLNSWSAKEDDPSARAKADADDLALAKAFARCFSTPDGQKVAAYLRAITLDRHLGPLSSDQALRHLEGQRHLAAHIFALTDRGRSGS
ncbi:MAG: hypothetical protein A2516_11340 [Alphaproteobacteria bacterium RIFOXYD12_FULL_60_8]|nr:MAG: hypothetical protein A2516_11340 [Alphaproteobacteria bacterium RIFOXYD12_FULL_60_8]